MWVRLFDFSTGDEIGELQRSLWHIRLSAETHYRCWLFVSEEFAELDLSHVSQTTINLGVVTLL
jgi:hypothetical protein